MPQLLTMSTHIIKLTSADYQKMFNTGPIFSIKFTDFVTQIVSLEAETIIKVEIV